MLDSAQFLQLDIIANSMQILPHFDSRAIFIFWHSNVWNNDLLSYLYSPREVENLYNQFILSIVKKYNLNAWKHVFYKEVVIGESFDNITGVITDGINRDWSDRSRYELMYKSLTQLNTFDSPNAPDLFE